MKRKFSGENYRSILVTLADAGYGCVPVSEMPKRQPRSAYIRHDIDLHIERISEIATIEYNLGVRATYYILLTGPYNPFFIENLNELKKIVSMGHEIGLHYDLVSWPDDIQSSTRRLDFEIALLSDAIGTQVNTIVRHQPSLGGGDPFKNSKKYINPHDDSFLNEIKYLSDSCRICPEDNFLQAIKHLPNFLHINTHPELWLNPEIDDPMTYLKLQVLPCGTSSLLRYYKDHVLSAWEQRYLAWKNKSY